MFDIPLCHESPKIESDIKYIEAQMKEQIEIKTKYDRKLARYSDWVGINASLENTNKNNGWKTWRDRSTIHPAAKEFEEFEETTYEDLANTV